MRPLNAKAVRSNPLPCGGGVRLKEGDFMSATPKPYAQRTHKKRVEAEHQNWTERQKADAKNAAKVARHAAMKAANIAKQKERYGKNHASVTGHRELEVYA